MGLEALDRRLFLRGLMLSSAGLVVPRVVISIPKLEEVIYFTPGFSFTFSGAGDAEFRSALKCAWYVQETGYNFNDWIEERP